MSQNLAVATAFLLALSPAVPAGPMTSEPHCLHRVAEGDPPAQGAMPHETMPAAAATYRLGALTIESPWSRASVGGAGAGGAFMTIRNAGDRDDRLVLVESDVAGRIELHRTVMEGGVMRMRPVDGGIEIPAGGMAELRPGSFHVMLMGLAAPLEEGGRFPVTLGFEHAGTITVEVAVRAAGAMDAGMPHDR